MTTTDSQEKPQQTYDNNSAIRTAVNRLTELLEWLYPDPSPDIFTVRDYRNRYPFTRLGPLATADIDRYQRVNRAVGNHVQIGLCAYHIGLIYLHEGAFRGAIQQFDQARQQWNFVNQPAAVGLTYLGRAVALQMADHYESALASVGKVMGWLERGRFGEPPPQPERFQERTTAYVAQLQAELRKQMDALLAKAAANGAEVNDTGVSPNAAVSEQAAPYQAPPIQPDPEAETRPDGDIVSAPPTPRPISNMNADTAPTINPIPDHLHTDDRHAWYQVEVRPYSDFMPEFNSGDWLLVDLQLRLDQDLQDTQQPILVIKKEEIAGTIRVRPLAAKDRFQRIYLVTWADTPTGSFRVDEDTGTVSFSPEMAQIGINRTEILGTVVGFWRPMMEILPRG